MDSRDVGRGEKSGEVGSGSYIGGSEGQSEGSDGL